MRERELVSSGVAACDPLFLRLDPKGLWDVGEATPAMAVTHPRR